MQERTVVRPGATRVDDPVVGIGPSSVGSTS